MRITWVLIIAAIWFVAGFLIAFMPLVPLLLKTFAADRGEMMSLLLPAL